MKQRLNVLLEHILCALHRFYWRSVGSALEAVVGLKRFWKWNVAQKQDFITVQKIVEKSVRVAECRGGAETMCQMIIRPK